MYTTESGMGTPFFDGISQANNEVRQVNLHISM